jgi:5-formyltetrahydrofolate cyclo-ligase
MLSSQHSKSTLRQQLRNRRQALSIKTRASAAVALSKRLIDLPLLADAVHIATYLAADEELNPNAGIATLREQGKQIYLPVIQQDNSLLFGLWEKGEALLPNRFGIGEPYPGTSLRRASDLDIILLPLVGWDRSGQRLGMGGGFYDRSLAQAGGVIKMGVAYDIQEVPHLPGEEWDVRVDYVLTESQLLKCEPASAKG